MRLSPHTTEPLAALFQARRAASALLELRDTSEAPHPADLGSAIDALCEAAAELPHHEPLAVAAALVAGCWEQARRAQRDDLDRAMAANALELAYATLYHALGNAPVERGLA